MPLPDLRTALRAVIAGEEIERLRRGCMALCVLFCVMELLSTLATPHPPAERFALLLGLGFLLAAYCTGYRRAAFPPALRVGMVAVVLGLAPLLGPLIIGAALTGTWLLALYPGARVWAMAGPLTVAIVIGEFTGQQAGVPVDPGKLIGTTGSLWVMTMLLNRLRVSLESRDVLQSTLTRQAHRDSLTDLPNRRSFHHCLDQAVERYRRDGAPYAVLMLDLDSFKAINDEHGHDAGDQVLVAVARRLNAAVRGSDCCARLGGDEFAVLVESCSDRASAEVLVKRIEAEIRRPMVLDGELEVEVGVSVGVTWSGESASVALRDADRAMYAVKAGTKALAAARGLA